MENEIQRIQVNPRNIHYTKRNVPPPPGPYKQCAAAPGRRCQVSWATTWQETYLAQTETTRNHPHQNVFVTWTQVKTLYKQQTYRISNKIQTNLDLRNTALGTASTSNIEIIERFQSKALRIIVDAPWYVPNTVIRRDLQTPTVKEEILRYSSQYSARLSPHPNDLTVNLIELPDNKTLAKWSAYQILSIVVIFVVLVF
jgi:hypothetical protein